MAATNPLPSPWVRRLLLACGGLTLVACLRFERGGSCPPGYRRGANALCERAPDAAPPCETDSQCNDDNPCTLDVCASGLCHWRPLPLRTPCTLPAGGRGMCSAEAQCVACVTPSDCDDGLECTEDRCEEGVCRNEPYRAPPDASVPCRLDGGTLGVCSSRGVCVECLYNWHCPDGGICQWGGAGAEGVCR